MKSQIFQAWEEGHQNVMCVLPTGLGKTVTFCSIAIDLAVSPQNRMVTAIMVHRKELVQQISLTLADEGVIHNIIAPRPTVLGIVAAQRKVLKKAFYDHNSPISVISVDTLNARIMKHENWAKSVQFWIVDEAAHLLRDNKWGRAIEYFPNARGLGVTATPERLDKKGLGRHADGVFDKMVEGPSTLWGINNDFLSKYKIAVPKSDYEQYLKQATPGSDYTKESMVEASQKSHIVGDVVDNYLKFADGKQAILFASDIETAKEMEQRYNNRSIPAKLLTGLSTDQDRLNGMIEFREKKTKVLINVDLFDEGLDVPGIECVIMARPTMSLSKYLQMIGRGLRPAPNKEYLIVIDHVGNVNRHGLPSAKRRWTLDRIAKRKKGKSLVRICSNIECNAPYDRTLSACPWCGTPALNEDGRSGGGGRVPPEQVDGDLFLIDPMTLSELESGVILEDPGRIAERVGRVAGAPAGIKAAKNQHERIATQNQLVQKIALWAGRMRLHGLTNRQIHKKFYIEYDRTIAEALAAPKAEMLSFMGELDGSE